MLPHPVVKDVGEDSHEDEDEVFQLNTGAEDEVSHGEDAGAEDAGAEEEDAVKEDEVEVLSSSCCTKSFHQKRKSNSAQNSSPFQPSTAVKGDSHDARSTSLTKLSRRRSKAVIEAEEDDDEEAQPAENISRTHVETLISKIADGADTPSPTVPTPASSGMKDLHPSQEEPLETMIFTNSHLQSCSPAHSCLSASAQEFQPRVQSETWKAGDVHQLPLAPPDLLGMGCHE